jgi:hypothetical protein
VICHLYQDDGVRAFPPASRSIGEWLSLVEHLVRDQGVGGSNPLSPTIYGTYSQSIQSQTCHLAYLEALFGIQSLSRAENTNYQTLTYWPSEACSKIRDVWEACAFAGCTSTC